MNRGIRKILSLILSIAVFVIGVLLLFVFSGKTARLIKRCTKETTATVIKVDKDTDSDGDTDYDTTIEFTIDGKNYQRNKDLNKDLSG